MSVPEATDEMEDNSREFCSVIPLLVCNAMLSLTTISNVPEDASDVDQ
jgi:hypothetical protein